MITNDPPFTTGENIRSLRLLKGIKQLDAAKKLGISQQGYSKIECSQAITETKMVEILKAFESNRAELDFIINFTPPPIVASNFFYSGKSCTVK